MIPAAVRLFTKMAILLFTAVMLITFLRAGSLYAKDDVDGTGLSTAGPFEITTQSNCRFGATTSDNQVHILPLLGAGVTYNWRYLPPNLPSSYNAEFYHMIRPRQTKTPEGKYLPGWYTQVPLGDKLARTIRRNPGAVWLVGNEPERGPNPGETWSANTNDMYPDVYAEAYHHIYHFIKEIDPTARVANAGLVQISPMRLHYLDLMWAAYQEKFGQPMPVDIWTMHAYVLPELTPDGRPNNIASAALGTDLSLGKRDSGGVLSRCADTAVYCHAEHDDPLILEEQVIAMRRWLNDHGQREKPLIITEYGTLYSYTVKANGACEIHDENGACFTPERVSRFMRESFTTFKNGTDPDLGMPADNNKLVQQWIWFDAYTRDAASSNLLQKDQQNLTLIGQTFRDYVQAEPTTVNLVVEEVNWSHKPQNGTNPSPRLLSVNFRNNGSSSIDKPFAISVYTDAALNQPIGSITISPPISGCATKQYSAEFLINEIPVNNSQIWVKLDSNNSLREANETDNSSSLNR